MSSDSASSTTQRWETGSVPPAAFRLQPLICPTFYDQRAAQRPRELRRYYHKLLTKYYQLIVSPGHRVLELGCGLGDLLAAVEPHLGVGVDASPVMVKVARRRNPGLEFHLADAHTFASERPFDYIMMSDLVNEVYDVEALLVHLHSLSHLRTRLVINFFNHLWRPTLTVAQWLRLKSPSPPQNWLSTSDMAGLLHLAGWELIRTDARILWPLRTPVWGTFCNRWLAPLLPHLCLTVIQVARPLGCGVRNAQCGKVPSLHPLPKGEGRSEGEGSTRQPSALESHRTAGPPIHQSINPSIHESPNGSHNSRTEAEWDAVEHVPTDLHFSCSVVVPARNEAGNIEELVERLPELGLGSEIIFVEGGSSDNTWDEIQRVAAAHPHRDVHILKEAGTGKGQAVRQGFAAATGDILLILDADLSVPPEELAKFYEALRSGTAEFVNGVRSVYPMQQRAMRFCNMIGNKFFSLAFGFLLGQPIKDTLCGTKALFRSGYEAIAQNRSYFGDFDPFGDFDLLFGAAKLNLRIVDLPIHYQARTYGQTNISRWRHGWLLLRMTVLAARSLKFLPATPRGLPAGLMD